MKLVCKLYPEDYYCSYPTFMRCNFYYSKYICSVY